MSGGGRPNQPRPQCTFCYSIPGPRCLLPSSPVAFKPQNWQSLQLSITPVLACKTSIWKEETHPVGRCLCFFQKVRVCIQRWKAGFLSAPSMFSCPSNLTIQAEQKHTAGQSPHLMICLIPFKEEWDSTIPLFAIHFFLLLCDYFMQNISVVPGRKSWRIIPIGTGI